jgi:hypothetical protein
VRRGDAQADLAGDGPFLVFEPARVIADNVGVGIGPGGDIEIDVGRFEHVAEMRPVPGLARTAAVAAADRCRALLKSILFLIRKRTAHQAYLLGPCYLY